MRLELDSNTVIHVAVPTVDMVEEFKENLPSLRIALQGDGAEMKQALCALTVKLINCNLDAVRITLADLIDKYDWALEDFVKFYLDYQAFIEEVENEKN